MTYSKTVIRILLLILAGVEFSTIALGKKPIAPATLAYLNEVQKTIGPLWYRTVENDGEVRNIPPGTVKVSFRIISSGEIKNLRIISNTSNQRWADMTLRMLHKVKLPPIPKEVLIEEGHNWIDFDGLDFKLIAN